MKFEEVKDNARRIFSESIDAWLHGQCHGFSPLVGTDGGQGAFGAMVAFVQAGAEKRQELRDFAALFCANPNDRLANAAKPQANIDPRWELETAWNQVALRAREVGLEIIDRWDVHQVDRLISLFPGCAPARYKGKPLCCFMSEDGDADWVIEVAAIQPAAEPVGRRPRL